MPLTYAQILARRRTRPIFTGVEIPTSRGGTGNNAIHASLWINTTLNSSAPPSGGEVCTRLTPGGIWHPNVQTLLVETHADLTDGGSVLIYDRLVHEASLLCNTTSPQTPALPALTRYTTGLGTRVYFEIYATGGPSSSDVTIGYTNEAGVASRTASIFTIGNSIGRGYIPALQTGDLGVRSIESVTLATSSGSSGIKYGVSIIRPLSFAMWSSEPLPGNTNTVYQDHPRSRYGLSGLPCFFPAIESNACLGMLQAAARSTTAATGRIELVLVEDDV